MKNWLKRIREKSEKGAIIVEATIALPVFIFAIYPAIHRGEVVPI